MLQKIFICLYVFANENRDIVRAENPGISFGQVGKLLGEKWKALNSEDKLPYENKAEADKRDMKKKRLNTLKRIPPKFNKEF